MLNPRYAKQHGDFFSSETTNPITIQSIASLFFSVSFCECLYCLFQLREKVEDKSKMPAELREKKTRAIRRRLTVEQV